MLKNSITIVEDSSDETKIATRGHLQRIVNDYFRNNVKPKNPWFDEFWRAVSNCPELKNCALRDLSQFKIDSKVQVLSETIPISPKRSYSLKG